VQKIIKLFATFFYIGYAPEAQGTLASLAALFLYYFVKDNLSLYIFTVLFLIVSGFLVSGKAEEIFKKKDASQITIDEASGMLVALFLIPPTWPYVIVGFILFRLLDIIKPQPIRKLEGLKGSAGVMLDDIAAGVLTNVILQTARLIF